MSPDDEPSGRLPEGGDGAPSETEDEVFEAYIRRINSGEPLDRDEIRARFPRFAAGLIEELELYQAVHPASGAPPPRRTLGDFELRREIARGGMGVLYDAWQKSMERRVALKVLPAAVAADPKACARFLREAQATGRLGHPNIVGVHALGIDDGIPYYAMEYIEGETIAAIVSRMRPGSEGTAPPARFFGVAPDDQDFHVRVASAFADVADGLQHAHSKGVVHRDIKPSNLILERARSEGGAAGARLRILDFGLARLEGEDGITASGEFVGTPLYMSPEQARRTRIPVDHRTDVYSLGATLYELLTLEPPFRGKDREDTLSQIALRDPRPPRRVNPRVPRDLETIVLKCLRKEAGDRYGTAEALAQDLRRLARGDPIEARPVTRTERWAGTVRRHRRRVAVGAAAGLLMILVSLLTRHYALAPPPPEVVCLEVPLPDVQMAYGESKVRVTLPERIPLSSTTAVVVGGLATLIDRGSPFGRDDLYGELQLLAGETIAAKTPFQRLIFIANDTEERSKYSKWSALVGPYDAPGAVVDALRLDLGVWTRGDEQSIRRVQVLGDPGERILRLYVVRGPFALRGRHEIRGCTPMMLSAADSIAGETRTFDAPVHAECLRLVLGAPVNDMHWVGPGGFVLEYIFILDDGRELSPGDDTPEAGLEGFQGFAVEKAVIPVGGKLRRQLEGHEIRGVRAVLRTVGNVRVTILPMVFYFFYDFGPAQESD